MAFSPDYVRLVLDDNFEHAKVLFLDPLLAIHQAHLAMLADCGIVAAGDARVLRDAIDGLDVEAIRRAAYDGSVEDLFFHVEQLIVGACGPAIAGRLHTARSRNDIDMTMYRMRLREAVLALGDAVLALRGALVDVAARHQTSVFPAHTHTQPAQPTTLAHYLLALVEQLERDTTRLLAAYRTTNRSPMGACAITGTGFPIDRARTSTLLGFDGPTGNTYGSIATVDYLLESAAAASTALVGIGRFLQDMLLWSTREVGYLRLPDAFVQISSVMPQKRNPVALEHARGLSSRAVAELAAIPQVVHNTPFGDIVDTEDDLQPLVATAFHTAGRAVALTAAAMAAAEFDVPRMAARAAEPGVTSTELADALVRTQRLSFGDAHAIVSAFVRATAGGAAPADADRLRAVARALGHDLDVSNESMAAWQDPVHFVAARRTSGGPSPDAVAAALAASRERLAADRGELDGRRLALTEAAAARRRALEAL